MVITDYRVDGPWSRAHARRLGCRQGVRFDRSVPFTDRADAGRRLGARLVEKLGADHGTDVVVLAMPRGGVPVAAEVARMLHAPLDVVVVRKLGVPWQPELAMGAIAEGGVRLLNDEVVGRGRVSGEQIDEVEARERVELERRSTLFRGEHAAVALEGRVVVVVDDGIATGSSARAACRSARARGAARVVLAVPVGPAGVERQMRDDADEVVCLETPMWLSAVGQAYADFRQTSDAEVVDLLEAGHR